MAKKDTQRLLMEALKPVFNDSLVFNRSSRKKLKLVRDIQSIFGDEPEDPSIKVRDITVVRQYLINGINLLVQINFAKKTMSFVEVNQGGGTNLYKGKNWLFAERTPEYLKTWTKIFDAQKKATELVLKELDDLKEAEYMALVNALAKGEK